MKIGLSDKDQTQVKNAFSSLWEVCGNMWDNIFDDKSEEKIQELKKQIRDLEEEVADFNENGEK
tara:strand:+ start:3221 stop:3412 length:192 start_codon:yes stop_codon:yes gene_type:complete